EGRTSNLQASASQRKARLVLIVFSVLVIVSELITRLEKGVDPCGKTNIRKIERCSLVPVDLRSSTVLRSSSFVFRNYSLLPQELLKRLRLGTHRKQKEQSSNQS